MPSDKHIAARALIAAFLGDRRYGVDKNGLVAPVYNSVEHGLDRTIGIARLVKNLDKFMEHKPTEEKYNLYGDEMVEVARLAALNNWPRMPSFLHGAARAVGATGVLRNAGLDLFNREEMIARHSTFSDGTFGRRVEPFLGTWLTFRLSSSEVTGTSVNVGMLHIRREPGPANFAAMAEFVLVQQKDSGKASQLRGIAVPADENLTLIGERMSVGIGVEHLGLISWNRDEPKPIIRASSCIPNTEATEMVASPLILQFIDGSDEWAIDEFQNNALAAIKKGGLGAPGLGTNEMSKLGSGIQVALKRAMDETARTLGLTAANA